MHGLVDGLLHGGAKVGPWNMWSRWHATSAFGELWCGEVKCQSDLVMKDQHVGGEQSWEVLYTTHTTIKLNSTSHLSYSGSQKSCL